MSLQAWGCPQPPSFTLQQGVQLRTHHQRLTLSLVYLLVVAACVSWPAWRDLGSSNQSAQCVPCLAGRTTSSTTPRMQAPCKPCLRCKLRSRALLPNPTWAQEEALRCCMVLQCCSSSCWGMGSVVSTWSAVWFADAQTCP